MLSIAPEVPSEIIIIIGDGEAVPDSDTITEETNQVCNTLGQGGRHVHEIIRDCYLSER
jgi:hypothetical protein